MLVEFLEERSGLNFNVRYLVGRLGRISALQSTHCQIVNNLFNLLFVVLEAVESASQLAVFQIQEPESGTQLRDEIEDLLRSLIIAGSDSVDAVACLEKKSLLEIQKYTKVRRIIFRST